MASLSQICYQTFLFETANKVLTAFCKQGLLFMLATTKLVHLGQFLIWYESENQNTRLLL